MSNRYIIPERPKPGPQVKPSAKPQANPPERSPVVVCMADVEPADVRWLWPGRIPLGRLTLLCGRPGEGKSFVTMDLAARVSTARDFPDGSKCPSGSVLIVSAEDDPADTIRPRLNAAGADVKRVHILSSIQVTASDGKKEERAFTLADILMLEDALCKIPDCRLVIIDPIGSYLGGGTDAHRDNEVRSVLGPVATLAAKFNVAVVMVAHRRKGSGDFADDSALGSRAFTGIARAVWHLSRDPDDKNRRLLLPGKNNLTAEGDGLAFRLEGQPIGRLVWEDGPVAMTADDAQLAESRSAAEKRKPGPRADARQGAANWLGEALANGPRTPAQLQEEAKRSNFGWRTIQNAAGDLGIERERTGFGGGTLWCLPNQQPRLDDTPPFAHDPLTPENSASMRECENKGKTPILEVGTDSRAKMHGSPESGDSRPDVAGYAGYAGSIPSEATVAQRRAATLEEARKKLSDRLFDSDPMLPD